MFRRVILTTYQFEGTIMAAYLAMKGIPWVLCSDVQCTRRKTMADVRRLVTLTSRHDGAFARKKLTSTWYAEKATSEDFKQLSNAIRSIGDRTGCKGQPSVLGYTLPESALGSHRRKGVQVKGYPHTKKSAEQLGRRDKALSCHVPCNARASNDWAGKRVMVHAFNRYPHPCIAGFLDHWNVEYSPDRFALNEMLQWVWRSAIRDGQPIHLAILSRRMRGLFQGWVSQSASGVDSSNDCWWSIHSHA
jgi:hypothetical protein